MVSVGIHRFSAGRDQRHRTLEYLMFAILRGCRPDGWFERSGCCASGVGRNVLRSPSVTDVWDGPQQRPVGLWAMADARWGLSWQSAAEVFTASDLSIRF